MFSKTNTSNKVSSSGAVLLVVMGLALSACGTSSGERAASGGALGAAGGAAVGALTGNTVTGALIGGAAGAAAGALTDPCDFNLGDPIWKDKNASREDYYRRCGRYPN